jgi:hypothetical protein
MDLHSRRWCWAPRMQRTRARAPARYGRDGQADGWAWAPRASRRGSRRGRRVMSTAARVRCCRRAWLWCWGGPGRC